MTESRMSDEGAISRIRVVPTYGINTMSLLTDAIESVVARASLDLSLASSFFFPVFFATPQIPVQDAALLDEIFTHLDPTNNPDLLEGFHPDAFEFTSTEPNFRHLSKVAETCKAFHGHSINFMWRSAALGNLLACLPTGLCVLDDLATGSIACVKLLRDAQRSRRAFREEDWARVSIYAARVRHLFPGGGQWSLAKILAPMILCLLANIFPVLKTLTWNHSNAQFCYIDAFLSPAIKTISFPCTSASLSFLSALPFRCPNLKNVTISVVREEDADWWDPSAPGGWDTPKAVDAISSFLCELEVKKFIAFMTSLSQVPRATYTHLSPTRPILPRYMPFSMRSRQVSRIHVFFAHDPVVSRQRRLISISSPEILLPPFERLVEFRLANSFYMNM
ncbi:hypothetical protein K438DRAFT_1771067 [Mycena galopus ATCC 62051]|nr:hypothetical protein K438DRAFT_1771067 [Mycena galopus ATCC 62051]